MDTFGGFNTAASGIFDFVKALPYFARQRGVTFAKPSDIVKQLKPVGEIAVPYPISDLNEAADVAPWQRPAARGSRQALCHR